VDPGTGLDDVKKRKILPLEADHSLTSTAQVKYREAISPLPHVSSWYIA
jgi:hypothetical protein